MNFDHPFTQYVRILGRGKSGTRSLDFAEAQTAMSLILAGKVEDVQLGAFLMLLRVKEESPAELAGFVQATRTAIAAPPIAVDLDWPSYASKQKQLPWYLLAALLLAQNGVRVFMHGTPGHQPGRSYTEYALPQLGLPVCQDWDDVGVELASRNFAFLPSARFCPRLLQLLDLRILLGLRSPIHSLARLLNPLAAQASLQGIFHPRFGPIHQQASQLLGNLNSAAFKGDGGELERRPNAQLTLHRVVDGSLQTDEWPRLVEGRFEEVSALDLGKLLQCWREQCTDRYGELAVIGTTAIALLVCGRATDEATAHALARQYWQQRNRDYFS